MLIFGQAYLAADNILEVDNILEYTQKMYNS